MNIYCCDKNLSYESNLSFGHFGTFLGKGGAIKIRIKGHLSLAEAQVEAELGNNIEEKIRKYGLLGYD